MFDRRKQPKNQAFGAAFIFFLKIIVDFPQQACGVTRHDNAYSDNYAMYNCLAW